MVVSLYTFFFSSHFCFSSTYLFLFPSFCFLFVIFVKHEIVQLSRVFLLSHFPPEDTIFPSHPFLNLLFLQSHFFLSALWYGNRSVTKKKNVWEILSDLLIFSPQNKTLYENPIQ